MLENDVAERVFENVKVAKDLGETRVTLELTDVAQFLKDHPFVDHSKSEFVTRILSDKEDKLMEDRVMFPGKHYKKD